MIRTSFLVATLLLGLAPSLAAASATDRDLTFRVYRAGSDIGTHKVRFQQLEDDKLQVTVSINLRVGLGPITFYQYRHRNTELWQGGKLISIDTTTNDNGTPHKLEGRDAETGFEVTADGKHTYSQPVIPTSYWNIDILKQTALLNSQSGEPLPVKITSNGTKTVEIDGIETKVEDWKIKATNDFPYDVDISFDTQTHRWVGLKFPAKGEVISYKLVAETPDE